MANAPSVRTHLTFRTRRFNQTEVHPHFINDCCFGEDCVAWLVGELRARGFPEVGEAWQEDWGWQTGGERDGRRYLVSVDLVPEDTPEWLVHVSESVPVLARLRGAGGAPVTPPLVQALHAALASAADITEVRWHFDDEFTAGASGGAPAP